MEKPVGDITGRLLELFGKVGQLRLRFSKVRGRAPSTSSMAEGSGTAVGLETTLKVSKCFLFLSFTCNGKIYFFATGCIGPAEEVFVFS